MKTFQGLKFYFLWIFFSIPFSTTATTDINEGKRPPNILMLISDDLRSQLGAISGMDDAGGLMQTPNIAALAASGTIFTHAFAQEALCAPSRNSFLSGRRPDTTRAWQFIDHFREGPIGANLTALPQLFREAGYTTLGAGKVYHKTLPPNWDLEYSWDLRMSDGTWNTWMYPSEDTCPNRTTWCAVDEPNATFQDGDTTDVILEQLANVTAQDPDRPWFLAAGFRKPHLQWRFPSEFLDMYPANLSDIPLPAYPILPSSAPDLAFHMPVDDFLLEFTDTVACGASQFSPDWAFPDECQQAWRRAYWASVSYMDACVGRIIRAVESYGQADNTITVFFGDHGWHLGEFGIWEKFTNFEVATRTPLIVSVPGLKQTRQVDTIVELVDLYRTLADVAGVRVPISDAVPVDGRSLRPLMIEKDAQSWANERALSQFPRCVNGIQYSSLPLDEDDNETWVVYGMGQIPTADNSNISLPFWDLNDCDDVNRTDFTHMGLSMRVPCWRLTVWYAWDGMNLMPDWDSYGDFGVELYDHCSSTNQSLDSDAEASNLSEDPAYAEILGQLKIELEGAFHRQEILSDRGLSHDVLG